MSSNLCINSQNPFEEKAKGYKRYSLNSSVAGKKLTVLLDHFNIKCESQVPSFLCHICYNLIGKSAMAASYEESFCARSESAKRKMSQRTPVKTPRKTKRPTFDVGTSPFSPGHKIAATKNTWKTRAITAIQKGKYFTAIRYLTKSTIAKRALQRYVKLQVRNEAAVYKKHGGELNKPVTQMTVQNFSWCNIMTDLKQNLPLLHACLTGAITNRLNENRKLKVNGYKFGPGIPSVGLVFSILMYQRHPMKFSFIQELCALEMWSSGCAQKLFQCFQHLGISKEQKGAISAVDRLRKEFDSEIKSWKQDIEQGVGPLHRPRAGARVQLFPDVPNNDSSNSSDNENLIADDEMDAEMLSDGSMKEDEDLMDKHPGFCMVWDNVQVMSTVRHQTSTKQNQMLLWALAFAVKNRIGFRELPQGNTVRAQDMPLHTFLPSQNDYDNLKNRMEVIVMRILKHHLQAFNECEVVEHIPHDFTEASRKKSRIVNLGVFDENPSSTAGVISIMDHLHQYVPTSGIDDFFTIPCHGDGLSIERMRDAKGSRSASQTKVGRLEGLEPVPQEFHKRMLIMQLSMESSFIGSLLYCFTAILFQLRLSGSADTCPSNCTCDWTKGRVDCSNNTLNDIPDFGSQATQVKRLIFAKNNVTKITRQSCNKFKNIETLDISGNIISEIESGAFSSLQKLETIDLNTNSLTIIKAGTFTDLPSLRHLILNYNKIKTIEDLAIANLPKLDYLELTHNELLLLNPNSISNITSLANLYLSGNNLVVVPTKFLSFLPNLNYLALSKNSISNIEKFAFSGCSHLKTLYLSENRIENIHQYGFSIGSHSLGVRNLSLETLFLSKNRLPAIPSAIKSANAITTLELSGNLFEKVSSHSLYTLSQLRSLHLTANDNLITIESKAFAGLKSLLQLFLSNNKRLRYIHEDAFLDSNKLQAVFLENNDLRILPRDLFNWDNLRVLNIQMNQFVCSCDIVSILDSRMLQKYHVKQCMENVKCSDGNKTRDVISLKAKDLNCPQQESNKSTKSRLITGLIAASVISSILLLCFLLISCRRKFYNKYIQFKYRRQRDDPLFTVEDPRAKSKMFSSKSIIRKQTSREETLM